MGLAILVINDILNANMVASGLHSAAGALTGLRIEYVLSLFSNDSVALGADHLMGLAIIVINDILTANMVAGRLLSAADAVFAIGISFTFVVGIVVLIGVGDLLSHQLIAIGIGAISVMGLAVSVGTQHLLTVVALSGLLSAADAVSAALADIHRAIVLIGVSLRRRVYALIARLTNIIVGSIPIIDLILLGTTTGAVLKVRSNSKRCGAQAHHHEQAQQHAYNFLHLLVLLSHLFCVCVTFAGYSRG